MNEIQVDRDCREELQRFLDDPAIIESYYISIYVEGLIDKDGDPTIGGRTIARLGLTEFLNVVENVGQVGRGMYATGKRLGEKNVAHLKPPFLIHKMGLLGWLKEMLFTAFLLGGVTGVVIAIIIQAIVTR